MASGPRKILRLPIMWASTNPMKRMPLTATSTFFPTVVRMAAGSCAGAVAIVAAVMELSVLPGTRNALLGAPLLHRTRIAVGRLEVGGVEGELEGEEAGDIGGERLERADPDAGVGGYVAFPVPPVLAAGPHQASGGPHRLDRHPQVAHHVDVEGQRR